MNEPFTLLEHESGESSYLSHHDSTLPEGRYQASAGPTWPRSVQLAELRETGYTALDNVLSPHDIDAISTQFTAHRAQHHADEAATYGHFWIMNGIRWCPQMARATVHPVALWLLRQFLSTDAIHYSHQPIITTLKPADRLRNEPKAGGWHTDYPYHPGVFPADHWPEAPIFGAQFNVCVDDFSAAAGAKQFLPGSHQRSHWLPAEFNSVPTRMGEGQHTQAEQMLARAGSVLIHDARTWHRTCHELNISGRDRVAFLNAVAPSWVRPMIDKAWLGERYLDSDVPAQLNHRERREIDALCHSSTAPTPSSMPQLQHRDG